MYAGFSGATLATTAAGQAIGPSGAKIRVYSIHLISGGTAGIIKLYNGTSTSGTIYVQETATTVSTGTTVNYGEYGMLFPGGCYYEEVVDANVVSTLISYSVEL